MLFAFGKFGRLGSVVRNTLVREFRGAEWNACSGGSHGKNPRRDRYEDSVDGVEGVGTSVEVGVVVVDVLVEDFSKTIESC